MSKRLRYYASREMNGKILAHGANAGLIGKDMIGTKDADGKLFMKEMVETAKTKGKGTVDHKWENPKTLLLVSLSFLYRRSSTPLKSVRNS